jgi:hypothetical protein
LRTLLRPLIDDLARNDDDYEVIHHNTRTNTTNIQRFVVGRPGEHDRCESGGGEWRSIANFRINSDFSFLFCQSSLCRFIFIAGNESDQCIDELGESSTRLT